jgi:multidrug efflux pump subunit AcrA (membrane-fusion protein)
MRNLLRAVLLLALLALVFAAGWIVHARIAGGGGEEADEPEVAAVEPGKMAVPVRTATVALGSLPRTLPFLGTLRASPGAEHVLSSRSGGRVSAVHGASGQEVHAGEVLLEFERAPLEAAKSSADAELRSAELALESSAAESERKRLELESAVLRSESESGLAAARVERLAALVADGLAAPKALEEARNASAQALRELELAQQARASWSQKGAELEHATREAALAVRRAAQGEAQALLEASVLKAPADGQLLRFEVREGDRLEPGASAGALLAHAGRELVCGVLAADLPSLHAGMLARWTEAGSRERSGHVLVTGGALDPVAGTVEVRIAPDAGDQELAGEIVRGEIVLEELGGVLLVPQAALVRSAGRSAVVLVGEGGIAHVVVVEVLARHAELAAVRGELAAGATLVVEGAYNLPEGARTVGIVEAPAALPGESK